MSVTIIRVTADTAGMLRRVAEDVFDDEIDAARLSAFCAAEDALLLVAVANGQVVGQARAFVHRQPDSADQLYIDNLGVTPSHRRQGIATRLMRALAGEGAKRGCEDVWLATERGNAEARSFYRSLDLFESGVVMFANFEDDDG